jgi:Mg-chelatase subunit ChlD
MLGVLARKAPTQVWLNKAKERQQRIQQLSRERAEAAQYDHNGTRLPGSAGAAVMTHQGGISSAIITRLQKQLPHNVVDTSSSLEADFEVLRGAVSRLLRIALRRRQDYQPGVRAVALFI